MTKEEKELTITYLTEMQEEYIEGEGYERHPLPEYYALDSAIKALEQQSSDDCVSRQEVIKVLNHHWLSGSCSRRIIDEQIDKVKALPPVTSTQNKCKDCSHYDPLTCNSGTCLNPNMQWSNEVSATHYCTDFEKRGNEND